jgi:hypothetical protein
MSGTSDYGDIALGVESALPAATCPAPCRSTARRLLDWLAAALRPRA